MRVNMCQTRGMHEREQEIMAQALELAEQAGVQGDVPVGALVLRQGEIVGRGYNRREQDSDPCAHAEIVALREAGRALGTWHLEDCELYVTLEPCTMCAGAIVQSRIPEVVIGAKNPKAGCAGSILNLLQMKEFNHQAKLIEGVLEEACSEMLKAFFRELREQ